MRELSNTQSITRGRSVSQYPLLNYIGWPCAKGRYGVRTGRGSLLFNYFVGTREHCGRNFEAERLGGLEIDDELEPGRLLDRQVGRFGAFENFVNEVGCAAIQSEQVYA